MKPALISKLVFFKSMLIKNKTRLFSGSRKLLIISFFLLFILTGCYNKQEKIVGNYNDKILLNNILISVEIVTSMKDLRTGLSYRDEMCEKCGMIFLQGDSDKYSFWMHEMRFPLDIIYIRDNKIVEIFKNVPIYTNESYTVIKPEQDANIVLELNAGFSDKNNIKIGDRIQFINN